MIHKFIFSMAVDAVGKNKPLMPFVDWEFCHNNMQKRHECKACRDVCPKNAIVYAKQIKIDKSLCDGCHLCHGVCPAQCIYQQRSFIKGNDADKSGNLIISCRHCPSGFAGINVPCIASLPWEFYAFVGLKNPISIMTKNCGQCPLDAEKHVKMIHKRLQVFWGKAYDKKVLSNSQTTLVQFSRRELFKFFARTPRKPFMDVLIPQEMGQKFEKRPGFYRNLLLDNISKNQLHGWMTWNIAQNCWGCKVCEKLCAFQAIQVLEENNGHILRHNVLLCTSCGLCKITCPEKSISSQIVCQACKSDPFAKNSIQTNKL